MITVAIDIGGTFTDLMGFDDKRGTFVEAKSLSTPSNLVQGILDCLRKSGVDCGAVDELIHGSTQAINTLSSALAPKPRCWSPKARVTFISSAVPIAPNLTTYCSISIGRWFPAA